MGKAVVGTCDWPDCEYVGDVEQVQVCVGPQEWIGDLCPDHQLPLVEVLQVLARPRRSRARNDRVYSMEEIEAMKKELRA